MITLREITADTLRPILNLDVTEQQKNYVASNAVSVAQAHFEKCAWFRGIYDDDTPVGFVMLYIDTDKREYWLWRFMIDHRHQKKGFGYRAMELVIEHVRTLPNATKFLLSYIPGDDEPSGFYAKLGFTETGKMEGKEKIMVMEL